MSAVNWNAQREVALVHLHISPRASRTKLAGLHGERVKLLIAAPPVDGAANAEVLRFLRKTLGLPAGAVTLTSGESSRQKTVAVTGLGLDEVRTRLGLAED